MESREVAWLLGSYMVTAECVAFDSTGGGVPMSRGSGVVRAGTEGEESGGSGDEMCSRVANQISCCFRL